MVIYVAHVRGGISQRFLAEVFDLPRSRIGSIIAEFRELDHAKSTPIAVDPNLAMTDSEHLPMTSQST